MTYSNPNTGKSKKYLESLAEFEEKFEKAAQSYLRKNIDSLKETNPGQAYRILKKMGAPPGECGESGTFTLPEHEHLSTHEAADLIAEHFSRISQEFPPLNTNELPEQVTLKLNSPESESVIPVISEFEVFKNIEKANKPKAGVPGDLPKKLVTEFAPELSKPVSAIFNNVVQSSRQGVAKWPSSWKQEFGTPLQKTTNPESEDDLRIISLTAFFSKVLEKFVVTWLLSYIQEKLDPRQFGGLKGNSVSHYLIELIQFILYNQDYNHPIAVLACTIDFSKAFNRQNHNILIAKLSEMNVPGWLLNLVMGFLSNRSMVVRYKGVQTNAKQLPGGGPQGTLLGLLLFLILINSCGFEDQDTSVGETITKQKQKFRPTTLHTKYVDDLTIAESINLKQTLTSNPDRPLPDPYHARTGHKLPADKSAVYDQIRRVEAYAVENDMKLNTAKSQFILFNPTKNYDFIPEFEVEGNPLGTVEELKLLGVVISNNLKWRSNTDSITKKAFERLWMIRRLKKNGANLTDLIDVYCKQVRSILEFAVPVWNNAITNEEIADIERVQKTFLQIALGKNYIGYTEALNKTEMETLEARRTQLCKKFATKAAKHPKHKHWFSVSQAKPNTRSAKTTY